MMKLLSLLSKISLPKGRASNPWDRDIDSLVTDKDAFNAFIYTPLEEAMTELKRRWNDPIVPKMENVPNELKDGFKAIMFRQVVTGNYEIRRFVSIVDPLALEPLFWEYYEDKFTSNNEWKHSLGKLFFYKGQGKKGGAKIDSMNIIDFNAFNGKRISQVKTLWGESLINFHHRFYKERFIDVDHVFFDASKWFSENGKSADKYYESFINIFIQHAILFDNFLLDKKELSFSRDIFLPAFITVWRKTGLKPLIVSLEPTDIEDDKFWMCHPHSDQKYVEDHFSPVIESKE